VNPEHIPDPDLLYRRIHPLHFEAESQHVSSAAFQQERMSVNWAKYATPQQTASPDTPVVVSLTAGQCRNLGQSVEHTPITPPPPAISNIAHAEVCGNKTKATKKKLRDAAQIVWQRN
jgi:hypothetical protein